MRVMAIVKRIANQFRRDKRTLALMFIAPLILITLINYLFDGDTVKPKIGVEGVSSSMVTQLKDTDMSVKQYSSVGDVKGTIKSDGLDAFVKQDGADVMLTFENSDPGVSKQIQMKLQAALMAEQKDAMKQLGVSMQEASAKIQQSLAGIAKQYAAQTGQQLDIPAVNLKIPEQQQLSIDTAYIYGDADTTFFDTIGPIFIGFFVFFFVFLIAGISFLRERTTGTLERLMATPIKRWELETGYLLGFGIFALAQSIIVALYSIHVLDMVQMGSIWYVLLITLMLAMVALTLGILLSTFANNEFQIVQFIPIVIVPQVLFCGIFPLEGMADWLQWIAHIMPLYYGADALTSIMVKGEGFSGFATDFYILVGFALVFMILNIFALKKYRKI
ncbi:ABC transporter permease [Listeria newyorkensis]|uniref:ABC transporter permease n=1 Tax=Listeria newyorkensis TaxID=1497681 RepID=A0ABX4XNL3_9LIST|nr:MULTISPECIES: ABC transporter permease [Listeria]KGL39438.1 ABC transporter permease [Listeriaceae bacterium FSL A5-0209]KGL46470.1 ABC transporter permease [Listeria newyorkensis]PNP93135.1 ABC transporter permease [Listeria newyorkensis]RQW67236.1 ABC transporter permease [Listeria sp. SHR_NRA_18]WAO23327.1 ABC transporter permease [Listeria newyorkensis]